MSEIVERLRAQSERLREKAHENYRWADVYHSLADLIDGMLAAYDDADKRLDECAARGLPASAYDHLYHRLGVFDGLVLPAIHAHVSAVLSGYTQTAREAQ